MAFDWGLCKRATAAVVEARPGRWEQWSRPFFLRVNAMYAKLRELRARAALLRRKVDRLRNVRRRTGMPRRVRLALAQREARREPDAVWRWYKFFRIAWRTRPAGFWWS